MSRNGVLRILSVVLLLAAGSFEPAWQLGHSVLHLESARARERYEHTRHFAGSIELLAVTPDPEPDHEHPVFQPPEKPGTHLTFAVIELPSGTPKFHFAALTVTRPSCAGAPARASPNLDPSTQPRAPPPLA